MDVGESMISYHLSDNPGGPVYKISVSQIKTIHFQNGSERTFSGSDPGQFHVSSESSQNDVDVIYLKNGGMIRGMIIEQTPGKSLKLQTKDGNVYVYNMSEILDIQREKIDYIKKYYDGELQWSAKDGLSINGREIDETFAISIMGEQNFVEYQKMLKANRAGMTLSAVGIGAILFGCLIAGIGGIAKSGPVITLGCITGAAGLACSIPGYIIWAKNDDKKIKEFVIKCNEDNGYAFIQTRPIKPINSQKMPQLMPGYQPIFSYNINF